MIKFNTEMQIHLIFSVIYKGVYVGKDNNWITSWISLWCELINYLGTDPDAEYEGVFP